MADMEGGEETTTVVGSEGKAKRKKSKKGNKRRKGGHPSDARSDHNMNMQQCGETSNAGGGETGNAAEEAVVDGGGGGRGGGKKRPREDAPAAQNTSKHHPFPTEYGDHFETPLQAYRDIEGPLALLSKLLGKKRRHLRIWDPYVSPDVTPSTTYNRSKKVEAKLAAVGACVIPTPSLSPSRGRTRLCA